MLACASCTVAQGAGAEAFRVLASKVVNEVTSLTVNTTPSAADYVVDIYGDRGRQHQIGSRHVYANYGQPMSIDYNNLYWNSLYYGQVHALDSAGQVIATTDTFRFAGPPQPVTEAHHTLFVTQFDSFITSDTGVPPNRPFFGGVDAADWTVTAAASDAGMLKQWNQLDVVYHAIVSTNGNNASARLNISGPIYNVHGDLIAKDAADLWDGTLQNPVLYDATGKYVPASTKIATGALGNGHWAGDSAGNFDNFSTVTSWGSSNSTDSGWLFLGNTPASVPLRLYGLSPLEPGSTPEGFSQANPLVSTEQQGQSLAFSNVQDGQWVDPPLGSSLVYSMTDGGLFTDIFDFPTGFSNPFHIWVDGLDLGVFGPGDHLIFDNGGVSSFTVTGLDATADVTVPFALKLGFNEDFANLTVAPVPEPSSIALATFGFVGLVGWGWRRRKR